jgi:long-chain acyl-CoA synthetase
VVALNTPWANRPGTVGRALPGVDVFAVDEEGQRRPAGADGELVIAGHCVMRGYLNKPAATAATVKPDGLHTGDIGHVDADGFIRITGRAKEMLIIGGENVFPIELESALLEHPAVAEAAVIGEADEVRGEVPIAFVVLKEGTAAGETELRSFCRAKLAAYKVPRRVFVEQDLPRGPTGKILKRALQARRP